MLKSKKAIKRKPKLTQKQKAAKKALEISKSELNELVPDHKEHKLTLSELKFVGYYILTNGNKTEAMSMARPNLTRKSASVRANEVMKRQNVGDAIDTWRARWFEDLRRTCRDKAVKMLATHAFYDPAEIINATGTFKPKENPGYDPKHNGGEFDPMHPLKLEEFLPGELTDIPKELRMCITGIDRKAAKGYGLITSVKMENRHESLRMLAEFMNLFEREKGAVEGLSDETSKHLKETFAEVE